MRHLFLRCVRCLRCVGWRPLFCVMRQVAVTSAPEVDWLRHKMAVVLGRHQAAVCTSRGRRGGDTQRSACEAWFALNRRAYQAVLNVAIQAELNMTSAEVTSRRRRDDVTELQLVTSADTCLTPSKSYAQKYKKAQLTQRECATAVHVWRPSANKCKIRKNIYFSAQGHSRSLLSVSIETRVWLPISD